MGHNSMLIVAIAVVAVFQVLSAMVVIRAAGEDPNLSSGQRLGAILFTVLVPIIGPLVGGRIAEAGMRPVVFSFIGVVIGVGAFVGGGGLSQQPGAPVKVASNPPAAMSTPAPAADSRPDKPASKMAQAAPESKPAPVTKGAHKAPATAPEANEAPAAAPAPPAQMSPGQRNLLNSVPAAPAKPAAQPAAKAGPKAVAKPVEKPATKPGETAVEVTRAAVPPVHPMGNRAPSAVVKVAPGGAAPSAPAKPVLLEGDLALPGATGRGSVMSTYLSHTDVSTIRLVLGAVITSAPGDTGPAQAYVGGRVYSFNDLVDVVPPQAIPVNELADGLVLMVTSLSGAYQVEFKFAKVVRDAVGNIQSADVSARVW